MPKRISINIGFITNSSSVVHHFPRELLDHPEVAQFLKTFEITDGFVGEDLWDRSRCGTFAVTQEQKAGIAHNFAGNNDLSGEDWTCTGPTINVETDEVVIIYGDEYESMARILSNLLSKAATELGISSGGCAGYN